MVIQHDIIQSLLNQPIQSLEVFESIGSTNDYLLSQQLRPPAVVIAEHQSAGRGRRQRNWQTPAGGSIALSLAWQFDAKTDLRGLSLAVAVMITRLNMAHLTVKWPNDIVFDGKKLAGILIDVQHHQSSVDVVIGIGMNTQLTTAIEGATDLVTILGAEVDTNLLCAQLIDQLVLGLEQFTTGGLGVFLDEWQRSDALVGLDITLNHQQTQISGRYLGVSAQGELLLASDQGARCFTSGVVSGITSTALSN